MPARRYDMAERWRLQHSTGKGREGSGGHRQAVPDMCKAFVNYIRRTSAWVYNAKQARIRSADAAGNCVSWVCRTRSKVDIDPSNVRTVGPGVPVAVEAGPGTCSLLPHGCTVCIPALGTATLRQDQRLLNNGCGFRLVQTATLSCCHVVPIKQAL